MRFSRAQPAAAPVVCGRRVRDEGDVAHRVGRRLLELLQEVEVREGLALRGQLRLARAKEEHAHEVALAVDLLRQGILCDVRLRLRALERPQRHLGSLAFLADASTHEEILLPIWPDVCHYDGWSPNISARDRVPTVAKSVDFAPRDYRKPARWGQTN